MIGNPVVVKKGEDAGFIGYRKVDRSEYIDAVASGDGVGMVRLYVQETGASLFADSIVWGGVEMTIHSENEGAGDSGIWHFIMQNTISPVTGLQPEFPLVCYLVTHPEGFDLIITSQECASGDWWNIPEVCIQIYEGNLPEGMAMEYYLKTD